jgi:hypothetical protein
MPPIREAITPQTRPVASALEAKLALTADQVAAQTSKAGAAERGIGSAL